MKTKKVVSKSRLRRLKIQGAPMCLDCQKKAGGEYPLDSVSTVSLGTCSCCGELKVLIPACDFNWPEDGRVAVFD